MSRLEVRDLLVEENTWLQEIFLLQTSQLQFWVYPGVSAAGVVSPVSIVFGPHPDMTQRDWYISDISV